MHPLLAAHLLAWRKETPDTLEDFVFPSLRLQGKKPPAANLLVVDYLKGAARRAGVVAPPRTFGFHTFRRTLPSGAGEDESQHQDGARDIAAPRLENNS
jgi:integrase